MMIQLPSVTLISLAAIGFEKTIAALEASKSSISFGDVKLVSPKKPVGLSSTIKWENSGPLRLRASGVDDYSHYFLYDMWRHIDTEFCLVVQGDGYVINPQLWSEEFLEFDYIGAPWPISKSAYVDPFGIHQRVGNGGFSLRSRKLMATSQTVDIPFDVNKNDFYRHFNAGSLAEDGNIAVHNRHIFEAAGNKFAPIEIAARFSHERRVKEIRGIKSFGFHEFAPHPNNVLQKIGVRKRM